MPEPLTWEDGTLRLLDQTLLPHRETYLALQSHEAVAEAIRALRVRGAPLIGVAAGFGMALAALRSPAASPDDLIRDLRGAAAVLMDARPTAVNLRWAVERCLAAAARSGVAAIRECVVAEAITIQRETAEADRRMGDLGAGLVPDGATVLTHCNTGSLATGGTGTAVGVIKTAFRRGKRIRVLVDETRPLLQGARLTAWELQREGIPAVLIVDGAAASYLRRGDVACVLVGADRIAANGDVANKVGTYPLAVVARENGVPFYVVAPISTIDLSLPSGDFIPIEERAASEVTHIGGQRMAPRGMVAANPAFDITPAPYVTAIVTDQGVARAPYADPLRSMVRGAAAARSEVA